MRCGSCARTSGPDRADLCMRILSAKAPTPCAGSRCNAGSIWAWLASLGPASTMPIACLWHLGGGARFKCDPHLSVARRGIVVAGNAALRHRRCRPPGSSSGPRGTDHGRNPASATRTDSAARGIRASPQRTRSRGARHRGRQPCGWDLLRLVPAGQQACAVGHLNRFGTSADRVTGGFPARPMQFPRVGIDGGGAVALVADICCRMKRSIPSSVRCVTCRSECTGRGFQSVAASESPWWVIPLGIVSGVRGSGACAGWRSAATCACRSP